MTVYKRGNHNSLCVKKFLIVCQGNGQTLHQENTFNSHPGPWYFRFNFQSFFCTKFGKSIQSESDTCTNSPGQTWVYLVHRFIPDYFADRGKSFDWTWYNSTPSDSQGDFILELAVINNWRDCKKTKQNIIICLLCVAVECPTNQAMQADQVIFLSHNILLTSSHTFLSASFCFRCTHINLSVKEADFTG